MTLKLKALALALPLAFAATSYAAEEPKKEEAPAPDWSWTAHVDVNSAYYLRGITNTYGNNKWKEDATLTPSAPPFPGWVYPNKGDAKTANMWGDAPEGRKPVVQWGADFTHSSGFYLGYWASQLTYSYKKVGDSYDIYKRYGAAPGPVTPAPFPLPAQYANYDYSSDPSIENDFYGGYTGKVGDLGYDLGLTYYYYMDGKYSNAPETKIKLTYGDFGLSAQTLLEDTIWGNQGDTYLSLTWTHGLPYGITFTANAGYYVYEKEGKFLGSRDTTKAGSPTCNSAAGSGTTNGFFFVNGCYESFEPNGTVNRDAKALSGAFRHLILGVSQPIGETGLTWNAQAIISGYNRFNIKQDDKLTIGIAYAF